MAEKRTPVAVITGASSGIGMCFARQLAAKGNDLILVARRGFVLESLKSELEKTHGIQVEVFPADLSVADDILRLEDRVESCENLMYLVNCAGFGTGEGFFPNVDIGAETRMLAVHNLAPMRLCRAALIPMSVHAKGYIINVASVAAFAWLKGGVNYCATKAFLVTFSKALQLDCKASGVRVQALCPGFVKTDFFTTPEMKSVDSNRRIPRFMWLKADDVVRKSLGKIQSSRQVVYVPTLRYRFVVQLLTWTIYAPLRWIFLR